METPKSVTWKVAIMHHLSGQIPISTYGLLQNENWTMWERVAIEEPFDAHRIVADRFDLALQMHGLSLGYRLNRTRQLLHKHGRSLQNIKIIIFPIEFIISIWRV